MKKLLWVFIAVMIIITLGIGACSESTTSTTQTQAQTMTTTTKQPITIKYITFYPDVPGVSVFSHMLIDKVKAKSNGELIIDYLGGPEIVPPPDAGVAVQKGTVDMAAAMDPFLEPLAPGVGRMGIMEITLEEFRQRGGAEYFNELYLKPRMFWIGSGLPCPPNYMARFHLRTKVDSIDDLAGMKFACVSNSYLKWFERMGATAVIVNVADYFTAMERGTVDAFELGIPGIPDFALFEVIKYELDHPYGSPAISFVISLDKWNTIPKNLQDIMLQSAIEVEQEGADIYLDMVKDIDQQLKDGGTEFVKFSNKADEDKFYDLYETSAWEQFDEDMKGYPEIAAKLKKLLRK